MLYSISRFLSKCILKIRFKLEVKGKEAFPKNGPFILASNHVSNLDPVVVGVGCPYKLAYLAKEELFQNKLFGRYLKSLGCIPLKRQQTGAGVLRQALKILKNKPMVIFPQGGRSESYDNFKAGVGFLQKKSDLPVIAAKVYGTGQILPKGAKTFKKGRIKVVYARVEAIKRGDSIEEIAAKVMEKIKNL